MSKKSTMTMASCIAISGQRARLGNHNQLNPIGQKTVPSDCILTGISLYPKDATNIGETATPSNSFFQKKKK
jgi:hypothetical protein